MVELSLGIQNECYTGTDIEFLSNERSFDERLAKTLEEDPVRVCAAIAFYSIPLYSLYKSGKHLPKSLTGGGFLCCDFMLPTDFDKLNEIVKANKEARVFINWRKVGINPKTPLLHSKLLLFDKKDNSAEIWVGSHNWTTNALRGPQLNFSMIIHTKKGDEIYEEAENKLEYYRGLCTLFDSRNIDWYKRLRNSRSGKAAYLIELEDGDPGLSQEVEINDRILLLDNDKNKDGLKLIQKVGNKDIFLSILRSGKVTFYRTTVSEAGQVSRREPFEKYRFVGSSQGLKHIKLEKESNPNDVSKKIHNCVYVIVTVTEKHGLLDFLPNPDLWREEEESTLPNQGGKTKYYVPRYQEEVEKEERKQKEGNPNKIVVIKVIKKTLLERIAPESKDTSSVNIEGPKLESQLPLL